ncbi:phosphate ABC transporter permease PstA [Segniliparus rugosus]|uniref:Phosphate transport system permease protein PstA n=1 Tax=Segniliparus rugosus (strain ATCC BAA-974 / DSM 45345 / CCUG 50838 / CIP 108380 / JCM 13579 / CDC 945) TaxID=679197 RepID=E5XLZ3_SEGRC|nr:phosphate ABC transporter permease PstA [Segniliparus rugosus]EFV14639.1 phosphate ABC transporter, permease PstA [Segniliparus rugosus ATCC BAA-974]
MSAGLSWRRKAADLVARVCVTACAAIAVAPLVWLLAVVVREGSRALAWRGWFSHSMYAVDSSEVGGGAYHAVAGTLILGAICSLVAVPLGVLTAVYLVEYGQRSRLAAATTFLVDILAGVPSIVATLFVFVLWVLVIGLPTSAFAAAAALVLLMVPLVVRSTEEMLRVVPGDLREASYALGITKARTILRVVLPVARTGIATGVMLALARALGESAPLLVLLPYSSAINFDPFEGNMASLPSFMLDQQLISAQAGVDRMWGAALTLIVMIAVLLALAMLAGGRSRQQKGR